MSKGHQPKSSERFMVGTVVPPPGGTGVRPPPPTEIVVKDKRWDALKQWIEEMIHDDSAYATALLTPEQVLEKMRELE